MVLAAVFGVILLSAIVIGDWYQFTSLHGWTSRYGFGLVRRRDVFNAASATALNALFGQHGALSLPHGVARWFPDQDMIVIRPSYHLFSLRFRTAWPLKGTIEVTSSPQSVTFHLIKRIPWTSALFTMAWLGLVAGGTLVFVVMFGLDGGFGSIGGVFLALGIVALGLLVLGFGAILLSLAYRLEDHRLMQVYHELTTALTSADPAARISSPASETPTRDRGQLQRS